MQKFDVIVVGARCAGAPTAMLLARQGLRVLLLDRAPLGIDTPSTHYIHQIGIAKLIEWDLLERLIATGCPPINELQVRAGPDSIASLFLGFGHTGPGYCPRRTVLDTLLVTAAKEAGAIFRDRFRVRELIWLDDRVIGVRGTDPAGNMQEYEASLVVGADGSRSIVAKEVNPRIIRHIPLENSYEYSYWRGVELKTGEILVGDRCAATAFPTNGGLACVSAVWPSSTWISAHQTEMYSTVLRRFERLDSVLRTAERVERMHRVHRLPANYVLHPVGKGWALVGDAGYHKDPITALGISDAFRDASLLANAVNRAFRLGWSESAAYEDYTAERDSAIRSLFGCTIEIAEIVTRGIATRSSSHYTRMEAGEQLYLSGSTNPK